ncbi:DUF192 domain-containing protein [Tamlana crocina]|uniref:DUF192 domain-containing protein n=1 Tax=Tamlana crocina TaxID=393006 RepID=A0ABX1DJP5_9FLAO|nr:DUF192 domain-containing protein [Tamlana crocina]NJX16531.1 DUF192 domain-containing protein [Tamlana crocina]
MLLKRALFVISVGCLLMFSACKNEKKSIKQTEVSFKKEGELTIYKATDSTTVTLDIEIADTEFDRETGLMYRSSMKNSQGMLFVFDNEQPRFFYMKNTQMPLDLIYVSADKKIVNFQKNAKPFDESSLPSNQPAQYVLEVNAGLADTWNLHLGDSLGF